MADVQFDKRFAPAEATRGQFVPIDTTTITGYPTGDSVGLARGRYATLNYIVGSEPGSLSLALSGGSVILPVSTVNISEPVSVENAVGDRLDVNQIIPNSTEYLTLNVAPTSIQTYTFGQEVSLVEVYNNDTTLTSYVAFTSSVVNTLSSRSLPLQPQSFYSAERYTTNVFVGNVDPTSTIEVRVVGHYTV